MQTVHGWTRISWVDVCARALDEQDKLASGESKVSSPVVDLLWCMRQHEDMSRAELAVASRASVVSSLSNLSVLSWKSNLALLLRDNHARLHAQSPAKYPLPKATCIPHSDPLPHADARRYFVHQHVENPDPDVIDQDICAHLLQSPNIKHHPRGSRSHTHTDRNSHRTQPHAHTHTPPSTTTSTITTTTTTPNLSSASFFNSGDGRVSPLSFVVRGVEGFRRWCRQNLRGDTPGVWILKDALANGGNGIWIVDRLNWVVVAAQAHTLYGTDRREVEFVVQRYVSQPMLWGTEERKFHLRVYALLTGTLDCHVYTHSFAHLCNRPYLPQAHGASGYDPHMHMTNVAQNTTDTQGVFLRDCFTVVDLLRQYPIHPGGVSGKDFDTAANKAGGRSRGYWWTQVEHIVRVVMRRARPFLTQQDKANVALLGMDLLPDQHGRLWLLEVNAPPCLGAQLRPSKANTNRDAIAAQSRFDALVLPMMEQMLRLFVIPKARVGAEGVYKSPLSSSGHGRWRLVVTGDTGGDKTTTQSQSNEEAWTTRRAAIMRSINLTTHTRVGVSDTTSKVCSEVVVESEHEGRSNGVGTRRIEFDFAPASSQTE